MPKKPTRTHAGFRSKAATAGGFKFGIDNMIKASKSAMPISGLKRGIGASMKVRPGVWHPGAEKP